MNCPRRALLVALCGIALGVGCSRAEAQKPPYIEDAVAQVLASGAGVAYFRIVNDGAADVLERVEAPAAADAQLHEMLMEGDLSVMRPAPAGFAIPARSSLVLEHGAKHVMLFGVEDPGNVRAVRLILHFQRAGALTIEVPVRHGVSRSQAAR